MTMNKPQLRCFPEPMRIELHARLYSSHQAWFVNRDALFWPEAMSYFLLNLRQRQPTSAKIALYLQGFRAKWRCLLYMPYSLQTWRRSTGDGEDRPRAALSATGKMVGAEAVRNDRIEMIPYATPDSKVTVCDISEGTLPYATMEQKGICVHSTKFVD